nr:hypothetical protein [Tomitella cavernea]
MIAIVARTTATTRAHVVPVIRVKPAMMTSAPMTTCTHPHPVAFHW